jgi:hypothetical protein
MNPAGRVRCNMANQIRLANHNCNFHQLKGRVLLLSTPVMTHSVCVVANPGPPQKQALGGFEYGNHSGSQDKSESANFG